MAEKKPFVPELDASNTDPDQHTSYSFPRDLKGYGRHPPDPQWPGGAKVAVSFVINYEEVCSHPFYSGQIQPADRETRAPSVPFSTATTNPSPSSGSSPIAQAE
jgi:hypothetical protein